MSICRTPTSRRHAQLQRNSQGSWVLQDLNSLNHVYLDERPIQQIVLESGTEVRIAEYRLNLLVASTIIEPGKVATETGEPWTSLGPGWLEQLHLFQRELLRCDQPRHVLEMLAGEFSRIAQPEVVAVGTVNPPGFASAITGRSFFARTTGHVSRPGRRQRPRPGRRKRCAILVARRLGRRYARPGAAVVSALSDEGPIRHHRPCLRSSATPVASAAGGAALSQSACHPHRTGLGQSAFGRIAQCPEANRGTTAAGPANPDWSVPGHL